MAGQHRMVGQHPQHPPPGLRPVPLREARWGVLPGVQPTRPGCGLRALRGLTGVLAAGLVVLAVAVVLAQWLVAESGRPGPGMDLVVWHAVAAVVATILQVIADRSGGARAGLAAGTVLLTTAAVLWFGWYT